MPLFLTGLWSFIQRLKIAPVISVVLLIALLIQTVRIEGFLWVDGFKRETQEAKRNLAEARAELDRISHRQDVQSQVTTRNIDKANSDLEDARRYRERVEAIPHRGDCSTPPEIMNGGL